MSTSTESRILTALPQATVIAFTGYEGLAYTWTKRADGRWCGRYISHQGTRCANGVVSSARLAKSLSYESGITIK